MADNTKIWPIFRWANWWISDDLFTWIKNSYYYSNLLEIREDAKSVYPFGKPAISWETTATYLGSETAKPVAIIQSTSSYNIIFVFVNKSVYKVNVNSGTYTLLWTFSNVICDAETFNWYIYITTTYWLYIIEEDASSSDWTTLVSSSSVTQTEPYLWLIWTFSSNADYHPLYASDILLCVWDGNEMLKVSKETCNLKETWFKLQDWYTIKLITELWWFIRIVAADLMRWSEILLWDKISEAPNEVIPFMWYIFFQTEIYNWYQYLLSDKWLWVLNWYQFYILKKAQEWNVSSPARNSMCVYDDKLYFCTSTWIYIYWAKNKNYNDVLSLWRLTKNCGCLFSDWQHLFTTSWARTDEGFEYSMVWIDYETAGTPSNLAVSWELQTMCYFWSSLSEIKQSEYLRIWYKIPSISNRSWNIKVYYRTDADAVDNNPNNWAWHEATPIWWLTASSNMRSPFATTLKLNCRFQWIQFKFILTNCDNSWSYLYTHLYSADLYYNVMLD